MDTPISSGYPNTSTLLKYSAYGLVFQHTSRGLDILMKHSSSCLIYYLSEENFILIDVFAVEVDGFISVRIRI